MRNAKFIALNLVCVIPWLAAEFASEPGDKWFQSQNAHEKFSRFRLQISKYMMKKKQPTTTTSVTTFRLYILAAILKIALSIEYFIPIKSEFVNQSTSKLIVPRDGQWLFAYVILTRAFFKSFKFIDGKCQCVIFESNCAQNTLEMPCRLGNWWANPAYTYMELESIRKIDATTSSMIWQNCYGVCGITVCARLDERRWPPFNGQFTISSKRNDFQNKYIIFF